MTEKLKIMLSSPMAGKTKDEIESEREEMANIIFDYYGEDNCEIISSIIEDDEHKSDLECLCESIFFMSMCNAIAMGFGWEDSRGCRVEHKIADEYDVPRVYLEDMEKELE